MKKILSLAIIPLLFLFSFCDDTVTNDDVDSVIIPEKNVSFNQHIWPLIKTKCSSFEGCHGVDDYGGQGAVILTSYQSIMEQVVAGDPETSNLILITEGIKMHPAVPDILKLNDNQKAGIKTWVKEGAKNN